MAERIGPSEATTIRVEADFGCVLLSGTADGEIGLLDLTGAGMERLIETDGSTVWVGIRQQYALADVTVTVHDAPPPPIAAWHITEAGLALDGDLAVHDGYVDAALRGTVAVDRGRWTLRVALLDEPDESAPDDDPLVQIAVDLWRPVPGDPAAGEARLVHAGVPQPSAEERTGSGTRQRRGALAWDSRMPMRLVVPGDGGTGTDYLSMHLDDEGALWGFWYDGGIPVLDEIAPDVAARHLADGTVHDPLR